MIPFTMPASRDTSWFFSFPTDWGFDLDWIFMSTGFGDESAREAADFGTLLCSFGNELSTISIKLFAFSSVMLRISQ